MTDELDQMQEQQENVVQNAQYDEQTNPFHQLELGPDGGMSEEQALAFQQFHAMHGGFPGVNQGNFPRATVKRRKPVKWEHWEEKNLIEGVRRFGRGNWAQIRAAFEFNTCRTNVDLHDKWRVLTGERKRNRQRQASHLHGDEVIGDDGDKGNGVQLIPISGSNGLYTLSSFLPSGFHQALNMEGQLQIPPELLQSMQSATQENTSPNITSPNIMEEALQAEKVQTKDDVAHELLKLSEDKGDDADDIEKPKKKRGPRKKALDSVISVE
jgi:hypothetical protein